MTDAQVEMLFERVLIKLEEIRCGVIDVEEAIEKMDKRKVANIERAKMWKDPYVSSGGGIR